MKYIIRKYVTAENAAEALSKDKNTPVHDLYLKEGEEPKPGSVTRAIGFVADVPRWEDDQE